MRILRRRDPDPLVGSTAPTAGRASSSGWGLRAVVNHVTFAGAGSQRMIAWYVADPQTWSFRSVAEGEGLIRDQAVRLSELVGTSVFGRVTSRPYPVSHWARAAWANAADPQPGFDAVMRADQLHMAAHVQADKLVFYGVDLGVRGTAVRVLGKVVAGAVDRELAALQDRLDAVDRIMAGPGFDASPAVGADLEWLLARSFALGCPVPVPHPGQDERYELDAADLEEFTSTVTWDAQPLAPTVRVTASIGGARVTRHVCVLSVARVAEIAIPERHEPWMAKADRAGFPVEWFFRVDPRSPGEVSKEMATLTNRIEGQLAHWRDDHGKRPPKQLARQADRAADVEDEQRSEFTGLSTRTRGWYRVAVSGDTEREAIDRADALIDLYAPQIKLVREIGQYGLAREFVPGEPQTSSAHARKFPVLKVAAGLPAITAQVGDRRGFHIGETAGLAARAVTFDPWFLPEVMEASGLVPVVSSPGGGKSMFLGLVTYKAILSGVRGVAMDPAGRLQAMVRLPELAPFTRSIDLLGGTAGSLSPYACVPDPNRALVRLDCASEEEFTVKVRQADQAARATRRDLAYTTLRWCLPVSMARNDTVQSRLRAAITASPDSRYSSAVGVIEYLQGRDEVSREIAAELWAASERELGRLFFPAQIKDPDYLAGGLAGREARFTVFNLKGLVKPEDAIPVEDYSPEELLYRPIMALAAWSSLQLIYRGDPHERKLFVLDEAHEITEGSGAGRTLVYKLSSDSRKNNCAALVAMQNASTVLGATNITNFVGAAFVGRTQDIGAQRDALRLLGKPEGIGYEEILGNLSPRGRRSEDRLGYREFIYRDGLGGDGGRGGMERIRVTLTHHPGLYAALDTTADPTRRATPRLRPLPEEATA